MTGSERSTTISQRTHPYPSRANVSQACESCRRRKSRCSGDQPCCVSCRQTGRDCVYAEEADGRRHHGRGVQREAGGLDRQANARRRRVDESQIEKSTGGTNTARRCGSQSVLSLTLTGEDSDSGSYTASSVGDNRSEDGGNGKHSGTEPWGVGGLTLAPNGNLLLSPEATWYRPAHSRSGTPLLDAFIGCDHWSISKQPTHQPHEAPYLPLNVSAEDHTRLIDCAFTGPLALGMNAWRGRFWDAMNTYCRQPISSLESSVQVDASTPVCAWFSPALHLVVLFNGLRLCPDEALARRCLGPGEDYRDRGMVFLEAARLHAASEAGKPQLSTITAHLLICSGYVGMSRDQMGHNAFAVASFLAQQFRVAQRCDAELSFTGQTVGGQLDAARRDVYGWYLVVSGWWASYYARPTLSSAGPSTQRLPVLHGSCGSRDAEHIVSHAAQRHVELSKIGLRVIRCNHTASMAVSNRVRENTRLRAQLLRWRETLPTCLAWPLPSNSPTLVLPSVLVLLSLYNLHVIQLLRPYIMRIVGHDTPGHVVQDSMEGCLKAAAEIIDLCRYMRDYHGMQASPLNLQHALYVAGTIYVLQASGLGRAESANETHPLRSLSYIQRALREMAETWPAALQTVESLAKLSKEYCL